METTRSAETGPTTAWAASTVTLTERRAVGTARFPRFQATFSSSLPGVSHLTRPLPFPGLPLCPNRSVQRHIGAGEGVALLTVVAVPVDDQQGGVVGQRVPRRFQDQVGERPGGLSWVRVGGLADQVG